VRGVQSGHDLAHVPTTCPKPLGVAYLYCRCRTVAYKWGSDTCTTVKHHRAEELEERVLEVVSGLLKEPKRLPAGLDHMIERERQSGQGDPETDTKLWLDKLAEWVASAPTNGRRWRPRISLTTRISGCGWLGWRGLGPSLGGNYGL
jgi:hypothetical protein